MNTIGKLRNYLYKLNASVAEKPILSAIQNGFTYMIPFVLLGSMALLILSLPIEGYQNFMLHLFGEGWKNAFRHVQDGTFNVFSIILVITISYSYAQELNSRENFISPIMASITALGSYIALLGISKTGFSISHFGVIGVFNALMVSLASTLLFRELSGVRAFRIRTFFDGANPNFSNVVSFFVPAGITIVIFAGLSEALRCFVGIEDLQDALTSFLNSVFTHIGSAFWQGMAFMLLVHVYWFFGIHGSNMLETVAQNIFVPALKINQELVSSGLAPTEIFTKTFFDAFVFMGGCGSLLCLMLAMFIVGRNKSHVGLGSVSKKNLRLVFQNAMLHQLCKDTPLQMNTGKDSNLFFVLLNRKNAVGLARMHEPYSMVYSGF